MNLQTYTAPIGVVGRKPAASQPAAENSITRRLESGNTMPALIPVPIETRNTGVFYALRTWHSSAREWEFESDWDFYLPDTGETYVIPGNFRFDGASLPKRLRAYLSPVGLLLVPGIIHDFGYRYDYVWLRNKDGSVKKAHVDAGQDYWDELFFKVSNYVNGVFIINWLARFALTVAGGMAWRKNRNNPAVELKPAPTKRAGRNLTLKRTKTIKPGKTRAAMPDDHQLQSS